MAARPRVIRHSLLLLPGLLAAFATQAEPAFEPERCWQELTYGASQGFLSATASLRFDDADLGDLEGLPVFAENRKALLPASQELRRVDARFSAMRNQGIQTVWYDPENRRTLQIRRVSEGKNRGRAKVYRFLTDGVYRERREPISSAANGVESWPVTSQRLIDYPSSPARREPVINSTMLLSEAVAMTLNGETQRTVLSFTDTQLFEVALSVRGSETFDAKFVLLRGRDEQRVRGERAVNRIDIRATLLDSAKEDKPFTLLELGGALSVLVDSELALPVMVEGSWYRIGTIPAALNSARLLPASHPDCAATGG